MASYPYDSFLLLGTLTAPPSHPSLPEASKKKKKSTLAFHVNEGSVCARVSVYVCVSVPCVCIPVEGGWPHVLYCGSPP